MNVFDTTPPRPIIVPAEPDLAWVDARLAVGSKPYADQRQRIRELGVQAVVSLVELPAEEQEAWRCLGVLARCVPVADWAPIPPRAFDQVVAAVLEPLEAGQGVLLHCLAGVNRAPTMAAAVLCRRYGLDLQAALEQVRAARPAASPLPEQVDSLRRWLERR